MLRLNTFIVLLFVLLLASVKDLKASHAMGADLTYRCLGPDSIPGSFKYELTYSFYRDCLGISAPFAIDIQITNSCSFVVNDFLLIPKPGSPTQISPLCPSELSTCNGGTFSGIEEWIYTGIVSLPGTCTDWTFSHAENARNFAITTLISSPPFGSGSLFVYSTLNNMGGICNDSPTFSNKPIPYACVGQRFCFNHGAYDAQGDSLSYELIKPRIGSNLYDTVSYFPGYSATQPVLSNPPMSFNSLTGDFCMNPIQIDVTVLAVLVKEYRNGVLIGQVERDIQLTVLPCSNLLPVLTGINGAPFFNDSVCAEDQFCFFIRSIDLDDTNTTTISWDNSIPGATLTTFGGHRDSAVFCWTPKTSDIRASPYCFTVSVSDDNCPYIGVQVFSFCIKVNGVAPNAGPDQILSCNATTNLLGSATGGDGNYNYTWNPGAINLQQLNNVGIGTYYLSVSSAGCSNTDTVTIIPGIDMPSVNFSFANNCSGTPVQFTDLSILNGSTISSWTWDFGDGSIDLNQNPFHQYANNGVYTVTLTVSTPANCSSSFTQQLTVNTNIPTALFAATNVCDKDTMNFVDYSTGATINSWSWNFNDTANSISSSNLQNPSHTFSSPGTFSVSLIVTDINGCQNQVQRNVIVYPAPDASIINQAPVCQGNSILYLDSSVIQSGIISTWFWDFGNGQTSTSQNPLISYYSAGNYSIILNVISEAGCSDIDNAMQIIWPRPIASFIHADDCQGNPIRFTDASLISDSSLLSFNWNLGDNFLTSGKSFTHQYATYGNYLASLIVTSVNGCIDSIQKLVNVYSYPKADIQLNYSCEGESLTLIDKSTVPQGLIASWNWTNGNNYLSNEKNPIHTFSDAGNYNIQLLVTSDFGCQDSVDGILRVVPKPIIDFTTHNVCLGNEVYFTDFSQSTTGAIVQYLWNFGDGESSIDHNPVHIYSSSGLYDVSLTAFNDSGCSNMLVRPDALEIYPLPIASFTNNASDPGNISHLINFVNETSSPGLYYWNFGDGDTSTKYSPSHLYNGIGYYYVSLITIDFFGCMDTTINSIEIKHASNINIPNSFTPNGDNKNDFFQIFTYNVLEISVQIFDRWGIKIVEWNDLNGKWDGRVNGKTAPQETYIYRVVTTDINDKMEERTGHVNLVR